MKITYYKKTFIDGSILSAAKIIEKDNAFKMLSVHPHSICIYEANVMDDTHKEATKEEFDNFYIDAVRNINELSKL